MKDEIRKIGWIAKGTDIKGYIFVDNDSLCLEDIFTPRGNKGDWGDDWPPDKVEVIVRRVK